MISLQQASTCGVKDFGSTLKRVFISDNEYNLESDLLKVVYIFYEFISYYRTQMNSSNTTQYDHNKICPVSNLNRRIFIILSGKECFEISAYGSSAFLSVGEVYCR